MILSLRRQILIVLFLAAFAGALIAGAWYRGQLDWERHLGQNFTAGVTAYSLLAGASPEGMPFTVSTVLPEQIETADNAVRLRFPDTVGRSYETSLSIEHASIRIFSDKMQYQLREVKGAPPVQLGQLFRSIATYCGDPVLFLHTPQGWLQIEAPQLWSCTAAPADWRTPILVMALILFATVTTYGLALPDHLKNLAKAISRRAADGRTTPLPAKGPRELRGIAAAINQFFDRENQRHSRRAALLSGISHDLGTPTTRLKLRTALISNQELREKLDKDIDQMTSMIDSVLAYTRNEMDVEETRKIPIYSLLEAVTHDYADLDQPVHLAPYNPPAIPWSKTVFSSQTRTAKVPHTAEPLLCGCRPNAIRRALTNLIENALKYGKSATLSVSATAATVTIFVQDEGTAALDFTRLVDPFQRGDNAAHHKGTGLGLTIVESIATSHGGTLSFSHSPNGTIAELTLAR